jgi:hypothetical protein
VALANLVADREVFAFEGNGAGIVVVRDRHEGSVDRTAGGDRASNDELDEITTRMKEI